MAQKLTDALVRGLSAEGKSQRVIFDSDITGFGIRVTRGGSRAFVMDYRLDGRQRRYTIGTYPDWTVAAARQEAKELRRRIDRGEDPMQEREDHRNAETVADLCKLYLEDHAPKKRDAEHDRARIERYIKPELGRVKVEELRRLDVRNLHKKITDEGKPIAANRVLALLSKMLMMAVREYGLRSDNPVQGIERNPENQRHRFLSQAEIVEVSKALDSYHDQTAADAIRFLMLTGARKSEVIGLTWEQLDLARGVWTKESHHTKQKRRHVVPLSAPALEILNQRQSERRNDTDHVFPGRETGTCRRQLRHCWEYVRKRAGVADVRLHDLRHSYASILASAGMSLPMIGHLLGHSTPVTTARYAHLYDEPLKEATEVVGRAITQGQGASVIKLRRSG